MNKYKITYEMELEAASPEEAAECAFSWMQDPASYPPILGVTDLATGEATDVDLSGDEESED
jgi:hypothetical protein